VVVVVLTSGSVPVVIVVDDEVVVLVVVAKQQNPTSCGWSCTSRALQTSRILTEALNVPSDRGRTQSTAA